MKWLGKVIGGAFGFMMGGPLGAAFGAAVGHQFDRGLRYAERLEADFGPGPNERMQAAFFTATFTVMGHLAKADGRVSEEEIEAARRIMDRMELQGDVRYTAMRLFGQGKSPDFPLFETLDEFRQECRRRQSLIRVFIELQLEAAYADGVLRESKEQLLLQVCEQLHVPRLEFYTLKSRMDAELRFARAGFDRRRRPPANRPERPSLADAYGVLGLSSSASEAQIKRAYRRLISRHHPDKLAASGLPDTAVKVATEKTQQIRKAYETIADARHF